MRVMPSDFANIVVQTYRRVLLAKPMAARVDMSGRNVIVTGGARQSIGYQVARTLAAWGADVVVTSLGDTDALERTLRDDLRADGCDESRIVARYLDLSEADEVAAFVRWYGERTDELHVLVNNAGVFKDIAKRSKTPILAPDGIEIHWRINFLGTFNLTYSLMPLLQEAGRRTGNSRVVITSSDVHHQGRNDRFFVAPAEIYNSWDAYSQAKLALVHFGFEIQRRFAEVHKVQSAVLHPGSVRTNLTSSGLEGTPVLRRLHRLTEPLMAPFFLSLEHGAQTTIACATMEPLRGGRYYEACAVSEASPETEDTAVAARLWDAAERWVAGLAAA